MQGLMDLQLVKQRREEMLREAERTGLARELRATRKRDAGRRIAFNWELKRHTGRLRKVLRSLGSVG